MPQVSKYKMELHPLASVLKFNSVCNVASVTPLSCLKPPRGCASAARRALFNPKCPNAASTEAVRLPAPPPSLVVVAVNLVKVHLHHVDPGAG